MIDWKIQHGNVIKSFLIYLNNATNKYILKGGTSLMLCYGLTRFSEDIDLDACNTSSGIEPIVSNYCNQFGFSYRVAKNTDTVKRYMIHYGGTKPVKVEISYRRINIQPYEYTVINGTVVYNIQSILASKLNAYNNRDRIRDLYDIVFICKRYWDYIPQFLRVQLVDAISYKGLEHFDYVTSTQDDELIDKNVLANEFLDLYYKLGLR